MTDNRPIDHPLYLAKYIERMGTGTRDMIRLCREAGLREPEYAVRDGFVQTLWRPTPQATPQVAQQVAKAIAIATEPVARESLQDAMGMKDREHFRQTYLEPLIAAGWLERTIPDKPTSPNQKYRLTEKGRAWLAARSIEGRNE